MSAVTVRWLFFFCRDEVARSGVASVLIRLARGRGPTCGIDRLDGCHQRLPSNAPAGRLTLASLSGCALRFVRGICTATLGRRSRIAASGSRNYSVFVHRFIGPARNASPLRNMRALMSGEFSALCMIRNRRRTLDASGLQHRAAIVLRASACRRRLSGGDEEPKSAHPSAAGGARSPGVATMSRASSSSWPRWCRLLARLRCGSPRTICLAIPRISLPLARFEPPIWPMRDQRDLLESDGGGSGSFVRP
jgi:hypothetical protein